MGVLGWGVGDAGAFEEVRGRRNSKIRFQLSWNLESKKANLGSWKKDHIKATI